VTLRIGNFVIVSSIRQQSTTSKIERNPDRSFQISCLDGSVGVLTLDGKAGQFLQAGQSLSISAKNEMSPFSSAAKRPAQGLHSGWLYLGLGGAAATLGHGGGKQSVSPSGP
jgi:ferric-dicitrate binding protein FerR (iron transport regulator)